jgi:hypothetical protein
MISAKVIVKSPIQVERPADFARQKVAAVCQKPAVDAMSDVAE